MTKVHEADKVMDVILKSETQAKREGIPKSIPIAPKSVFNPQRIMP